LPENAKFFEKSTLEFIGFTSICLGGYVFLEGKARKKLEKKY